MRETTSINEVIKGLKEIPNEKYVLDFLFNRKVNKPTRSPEDPLLKVEISYIAFVPLLEAIGARMKTLWEEAFDDADKIISPDKLLDFHGLLDCIASILGSAILAEYPIEQDCINTVNIALKELQPLVNEATSCWD